MLPQFKTLSPQTGRLEVQRGGVVLEVQRGGVVLEVQRGGVVLEVQRGGVVPHTLLKSKEETKFL